MARARVIILVASATAVLGLCLPAVALAGTYTWALPSDFTTAPPGANPDRDAYGTRPWRYLESDTAGDQAPSTFQRLSVFSQSVDGGLTGWSDPTNSNAFIAENASGSTISGVQPGELAMHPGGSGQIAAIGWNSPFAQRMQLNVSASVSTSCLLSPITWNVEDQNGKTVSSNGPVAVPRGGSLYLVVQDTSLIYTSSCDTAVVSFTITAHVTAGPKISLTSPGQGAVIAGRQPTFAGLGGTGFGSARRVTVRVYSGTSASPSTLVETLASTRSASGQYSVAAQPALADGRYVAQAEQDDVSSPSDQSFSNAVAFTVHNAPPEITLNSLGSKPLHTATPTLTGVAGTAAGDASSVAIAIYPGSDTTTSALRLLSGPVGPGGRFSIKINPRLRDGQYTAVAAQGAAGATAYSAPLTFAIKVHAPAITLNQPVDGAEVPATHIVFAGVAGTVIGDSAHVDVKLFRGSAAKGHVLMTLHATAVAGRWSTTSAHALKLGRYTAVAIQHDDAGHTGITKPHTFLVARAPQVIGSRVMLDNAGFAGVPIACRASAACSGDVLILTVGRFQPDPGGPRGRVRVLFAYVAIRAGQTRIVRRPVSSDVARVLRRAAPLKVSVSATLSRSSGPATTTSVVRVLRLGS